MWMYLLLLAANIYWSPWWISNAVSKQPIVAYIIVHNYAGPPSRPQRNYMLAIIVSITRRARRRTAIRGIDCATRHICPITSNKVATLLNMGIKIQTAVNIPSCRRANNEVCHNEPDDSSARGQTRSKEPRP